MQAQFSALYDYQPAHHSQNVDDTLQSHISDAQTSASASSPSPLSAPTSLTASSIGGRAVRTVRILWDIENIRVNKKIGGLETVRRLLSFLQHTAGVALPGQDVRITAFFLSEQ